MDCLSHVIPALVCEETSLSRLNAQLSGNFAEIERSSWHENTPTWRNPVGSRTWRHGRNICRSAAAGSRRTEGTSCAKVYRWPSVGNGPGSEDRTQRTGSPWRRRPGYRKTIRPTQSRKRTVTIVTPAGRRRSCKFYSRRRRISPVGRRALIG